MKNFKDKFVFPKLFNKIFTRSNLNKIIIIFIVGFTSRMVVNCLYNVNVYYEYLKIISLLYYGLMSLFIVLTHELVVYFDINIIPSFISEYFVFVYGIFNKLKAIFKWVLGHVRFISHKMKNNISFDDLKLSSIRNTFKSLLLWDKMYTNNINIDNLNKDVTFNQKNLTKISMVLNRGEEGNTEGTNIHSQSSNSSLPVLTRAVYSPNVNINPNPNISPNPPIMVENLSTVRNTPNGSLIEESLHNSEVQRRENPSPTRTSGDFTHMGNISNTRLPIAYDPYVISRTPRYGASPNNDFTLFGTPASSNYSLSSNIPPLFGQSSPSLVPNPLNVNRSQTSNTLSSISLSNSTWESQVNRNNPVYNSNNYSHIVNNENFTRNDSLEISLASNRSTVGDISLPPISQAVFVEQEIVIANKSGSKGRFHIGFDKLKSKVIGVFAHYEDVARRKFVWYLWKENNYDSYEDFKKDWNTNTRIWDELKKRIKADFNAITAGLFGPSEESKGLQSGIQGEINDFIKELRSGKQRLDDITKEIHSRKKRSGGLHHTTNKDGYNNSRSHSNSHRSNNHHKRRS